MTRQPPTLFLASAMASHHAVTATISQEVTDARQEGRISARFALSPYLRAHGLNVSVASGMATLSGHVAEAINKQLAQQIALGITGISAVDNQIVIDTDYQPAKPVAERSFREVITAAAAKAELVWSRTPKAYPSTGTAVMAG